MKDGGPKISSIESMVDPESVVSAWWSWHLFGLPKPIPLVKRPDPFFGLADHDSNPTRDRSEAKETENPGQQRQKAAKDTPRASAGLEESLSIDSNATSPALAARLLMGAGIPGRAKVRSSRHAKSHP